MAVCQCFIICQLYICICVIICIYCDSFCWSIDVECLSWERYPSSVALSDVSSIYSPIMGFIIQIQDPRIEGMYAVHIVKPLNSNFWHQNLGTANFVWFSKTEKSNNYSHISCLHLSTSLWIEGIAQKYRQLTICVILCIEPTKTCKRQTSRRELMETVWCGQEEIKAAFLTQLQMWPFGAGIHNSSVFYMT